MKKNLFTHIKEAIDQYRATQTPNQATPTVPTERGASQKPSNLSRLAHWLLPVGISVVTVVLLIATQSLWLTRFRSPTATSPKTIPYQGRLTDPDGIPLTGKFNMEFRLYDVPMGGTPLWEEDRTGSNSVQVSDGLVNVMLGSINNTLASTIYGHDELYLGITVGNDIELSPRVPLASVPFAMGSQTLFDGAQALGSLEVAGDLAVAGKYHADDVQLHQATHDWSWSTTSTSWTTVGNLKITLTVDHDSLLIMTANGHVNSDEPDNPSFYASFFVDGNHPVGVVGEGGYLGQYHIYENVTDGWAPLNFSQFAIVEPGTHTVEVKATVTSGSTWTINGSGIQVAVIPK